MYRFFTPFGYLFLLICGTIALAEPTYATATDARVRPLETFKDCDVCPEMIVLPLGAFQMGSTVKEANAAHLRFFSSRNIETASREAELRQALIKLRIDPDNPEQGLRGFYSRTFISQYKDPQYSINPLLHEVPKHRVEIDQPIAMGRNEVTRQEWQACVEGGGCGQGLTDVPSGSWAMCLNDKTCTLTPDDRIRFRLQQGPHPTDPRAPRTGITFYEMLNYVAWLNQQVGAEIYRIPTEAEWEYAARAGTTTRYAQGDTLSLKQANFMVSRRDKVNGKYVWTYNLGAARELLPVDHLDAANPWGLRHMSGNASEFTASCGAGPHRGLETSSAYRLVDQDRPDCKRALKGGMYYGNVELARPARRVAISASHWAPSLGFRVVRDLSLAWGTGH